MAKTVIDELIVALKLDPKDFDKGTKKVASEILKAKKEVRSATDDMSKGAESAARSFSNAGGVIGKVFSRGGAIGLAIAVAVAAGTKLNDMLYEVAENTRKLGLDARAYNTTAAGLRNMQNAAELAGGSLEDANASAGSLVKSLFDLKFNGAVSDQLIQLGRLGVQFTDASGKARDFKDVTLDTAEALERMQRSGQMSQSEAIQFAQQAGFTGGMAQLVASGRGAVSSALARQEGRRQVTGEDVTAGTGWVNANLSRGQAGLSELGVPLMRKDANLPGVGGIARNQALESGIKGLASLPDKIGEGLASASDKASEALGDLADSAKAVGNGMSLNPNNAQPSALQKWMYKNAISVAADRNGIPRNILQGIARTESAYNPNARAVDKSGTVTGAGIMQLNPKFFPNAGKNAYADIDTAARHYADLYSRTEGTQQERTIAALRMYHAGETNYRNGTNLGPANRAYASKVMGTSLAPVPSPNAQAATAGNNRTDITFENVTIQARGTDGEAMATDFVDGTRRKLLAAQADAGMQ